MDNGPEPAPHAPPDTAPASGVRSPKGSLEHLGADPDPEERADNIARLQADRELRDALAAEGFAGPAYAVFEEEYVGFGYELMTALFRTGYIFARCYEEGIRLRVLPIPVGDREDLVQETVEKALRSFKAKGLEQGGWQPERGASLKTYFAGALLRNFANIWRARLNHTPDTADLPFYSVPSELLSLAPDPADLSAQYDMIRRGLMDIENPKTRAALVLTEDGYEQDEIAEILGLTRRAVEGLLRRHRRRLAAGSEEGESR
jgi:DNA-directed RNA polymerase specialized sigma24 family protein